MANKLLDFQASITDVKQINPLFSTCRVRVLYAGRNRNTSYISKQSVENALPTLIGIPIVGEYSEENADYKGHGGKIDLDSYKYIHTTKPYGFVPESATYEWEEVRGKDGVVREYLSINGCYLWTGRYEEAYSVIENGKSQSMEIQVTDGEWDDEKDAYRIDNFVFSALCILGDDVEPAFEDANITAYSLDKDSFKQEFSLMLEELKKSLNEDKEVETMLKELLEKYSLTVEDLTAKGINFSEISEEELEAKIIEVFEIDTKEDNEDNTTEEVVEPEVTEPEVVEPEVTEPTVEPEVVEPEIEEPIVEPVITEPEVVEPTEDVDALKDRIAELEGQLEDYEALKAFKLEVEKAQHETKVQELFTNFQLTEEDVKELDIHAFSVEEIEEKCYAILGRKLATNKNFSLKDEKENSVKLPVQSINKEEEATDGYGGLFEKYKNQ